jgi:hypothetical protein
MAAWYGNGSVTPPEPEPGRWERREWDRFLQRIGHADAAAVGTLQVISIYSHFKTPKQVLLSFSPTEILHGSFEGMADADRTLELTLSEADEDFEIALRAQSRVAGTRYLLFAKAKPQRRKWGPPQGWRGSLWREVRQERKNFRWVLYRPDASLLKRVRTMYRWLKQK